MNDDWKLVTNDVYYAPPGLTLSDAGTIARLKAHAETSPRKRARLCYHDDADARLHNMLIVMQGGAYVRPHKHLQKAESFLVLEGRGFLCLFKEDGTPEAFSQLAGADNGGTFFYHMPVGRFHTQLFLSDWVVFHESTLGPFNPDETTQAPWAPPEGDPGAESYMKELLAMAHASATAP